MNARTSLLNSATLDAPIPMSVKKLHKIDVLLSLMNFNDGSFGVLPYE